MIKPTDFSHHVTNFLSHYLAEERNLSPNTIKAYRDVFMLLLNFVETRKIFHLKNYHWRKLT